MKANVQIPATPPGPPAWPLLNWRINALRVAFDPMVYLLKLYRDYGPLASLARGSLKYIFAFGPQYNHQILSNPGLFHEPSVEDSTMPFKTPHGSAAERLSTGLNLINDEKHKRLRRLIMPAFQKKRVEAYRDEMANLTRQKLAGWKPGQITDIALEMYRLTHMIAVKTLWGLDPSVAGEKSRQLIDYWVRLSFNPITILLPYDLPGLPFRRFLKVSEQAEAAMLAMVKQKRAAGIDNGDVLSMLLLSRDEDGSMLNDQELVGQLIGLFIAGHETTANTLTWTLFLLAQHPQILADLLDELEGQLQGEAPTIEQLNSLPLLDRVIKESMRLLPPVQWAERINMAPVKLGSYELPARTFLIYSPAVTQRLPELYSQPNRFNPARWESMNPSIYEYLPFGAGPRMCIGSSFAIMEIKIVLSIILQRYYLKLPDGCKIDRAGFTILTPKKGLPVFLEPQRHQFSKATVKGNINAVIDLT